MEFGEWEKPLNVPDAPSRSCGFLRRVAVWLSHTTSWFKHNRDGRLHGCSEERGTREIGTLFLNLIITTLQVPLRKWKIDPRAFAVPQ